MPRVRLRWPEEAYEHVNNELHKMYSAMDPGKLMPDPNARDDGAPVLEPGRRRDAANALQPLNRAGVCTEAPTPRRAWKDIETYTLAPRKAECDWTERREDFTEGTQKAQTDQQQKNRASKLKGVEARHSQGVFKCRFTEDKLMLSFSMKS